jgi:phage shock protein C
MQYESPTQPPRQRLTRSAREKMIAGVAGGLAEYFDLDPVVVRLLWIAAGILTGGLAIPAYGLMWWIMPRQDEVGTPLGWRSTAGSAVGDSGVAPEPVATASAGAAAGHASASVATGGEPTAATAYGEAPSAGYADEPSATTAYTSAPPPSYPAWSVPDHRRRRQRTAGVILIGLGLIFMAHQSGIFSWYAWRYFWPVVLIAVGAALLVRQNAWRR